MLSSLTNVYIFEQIDIYTLNSQFELFFIVRTDFLVLWNPEYAILRSEAKVFVKIIFVKIDL